MVMVISTMTYVVCGFSKYNLLISWVAGLVVLIITVVVWTLIYPHLKSSQKDMYYDNEDDMKKGLCSQKEEDEEFIKSFMYNDSLIWSVCLKQKLFHD